MEVVEEKVQFFSSFYISPIQWLIDLSSCTVLISSHLTLPLQIFVTQARYKLTSLATKFYVYEIKYVTTWDLQHKERHKNDDAFFTLSLNRVFCAQSKYTFFIGSTSVSTDWSKIVNYWS